MIALTVMTGALTKKGKLTLFTKVKLWSQMWIAKWLHFNRNPYCYVFPQGAEPGQWVRPCDAMSVHVLMRDPYCTQVYVPDKNENLLSRDDRVAFVEDVAKKHDAKVFGFGMIFRPAHYRGLEDDPMKDIFQGDIPVLPSDHKTNVVPIRRRP